MEYSEKEIKNGINLHLINTDKFKTNIVAIFLSTELTRENVTKNAVLTSVLRRGSNKLRTQEELSKKLEEMYGAEFDCGLDKIGKNHVLKFYIECINDNFLPQNENNVLKSSIEILTDIIFNPKNDGSKLDKEYIKQEKENVRQIIDAKKDNKASYAAFRCMEEMYKDSPCGLYRYGYIEDLNGIDEKNLYEYFVDLIKECKIDIFISGELRNFNVEEIIENNENISKLSARNPKYVVNNLEKKTGVEKENIVKESMEVTQGKLVIGYDLIIDEKTLQNENLRYIGMVYNGILGGSANSKLFQNVREKESLAYTTSSSFAYNSGNIFINAGIDIQNYDKALKIIKQQVEDMKNERFNDDDIDNAKETIISNINSIDDEQDTEIIYFLGQTLRNKNVSINEYIEKIQNVTKNDIIEFAKNIKINTIYFLKN